MKTLSDYIPDPDEMTGDEVTEGARHAHASGEYTITDIANHIGLTPQATSDRLQGKSYASAGGPLYEPTPRSKDEDEDDTYTTRAQPMTDRVAKVQSDILSIALIQAGTEDTGLTTVLETHDIIVQTDSDQSEYVILGRDDTITICRDAVAMIQECICIAGDSGDDELMEDVQGIAQLLSFPL